MILQKGGMHSMDTGKLNTRSLVGIVWRADVASAVALMLDKNICALGVYSTDGHQLMGILTERDVTRVVADKSDPANVRVGDAMSYSPVTVEGSVTAPEAAEMMRHGHIRHLIIREAGSDRIISIRDLLEADFLDPRRN
jgi:CBS domain-containing protein